MAAVNPTTWRVLTGRVEDHLPTFEPESFDACLCDPPYGLTANKRGGSGAASLNLDSPAGRSRISTGGSGFMGKEWDARVPGPEIWREVLRCLKPGAFLLAFGGTRTFHRLTCAIEDAGFEIRDCALWLHGQGFPKSLDISAAIDKAAGVVRAEVGRKAVGFQNQKGEGFAHKGTPLAEGLPVTAPATEEARAWDGYGTALKPAWESCIVAQKPLDLATLCGILAHNLQEAVCQISDAMVAGSPSTSSPPRSVAADSALWGAVRECNTPAALFDLMATFPSGRELPSSLSIAWSWLLTLAEASELASTFTTETASSLTTVLRTLNCSPSPITPDSIIEASIAPPGTGRSVSLVESAFSVARASLDFTRARSAGDPATSLDEGLGLRPSWEPCIVAMKPLDGTFAANALRHGVAGLNVDGCRIGQGKEVPASAARDREAGPAKGAERGRLANTDGFDPNVGRWPANVILDEEAAELLDRQAGPSAVTGNRSAESRENEESRRRSFLGDAWSRSSLRSIERPGDTGSPSRFFYASKVRPEERNLGGIDCRHPTLKPIDLCEYLARLILPPKRPDAPRRLLVPFAGAGSEICGALEAGWEDVVGIEMEEQSAEWARARIAALLSTNPAERKGRRDDAGQVLQRGLFE